MTAHIKRPVGRPRKGNADDKRMRFTVVADPDEEKLLRLAAASRSQSLTDFITKAALDQARRAMAGEIAATLVKSPPAAATPELLAELTETKRHNDQEGWYEVDEVDGELDFTKARRISHAENA